MRTNVGSGVRYAGENYHGVPTREIGKTLELRRSVMSLMLFEDTFYETGVSTADRIKALIPQVDPAAVAQIAIDARTKMHLRHAPLFIVREMARHASHRPFVRATLGTVIQRADELAEFMAIYWKGDDKDKPLAKSVQRGLADAFAKFNAYQLAKYNRDAPVKLRDVLFLTHAKPKVGRKGYTKLARKDKKVLDAYFEGLELNEQELAWKGLVDGTLPAPNTWEVKLSEAGKTGKSKTTVWTELLEEKALGGFALIRNLRNMTEAKVDDLLIRQALLEARPDKILPFRFIAAAKHAPRFVSELDAMLMKNVSAVEKWPGRTIVLVDGSASMEATISEKSQISRIEAAAGVAMYAREVCESCRVFVFSSHMREAPSYRGLALTTALAHLVPAAATLLGAAVRELNKEDYDRIIVITDEQSQDKPPAPNGKGYVINVATYKNGVGYGQWNHIDGWSDAVLDFIRLEEQLQSSTVEV